MLQGLNLLTWKKREKKMFSITTEAVRGCIIFILIFLKHLIKHFVNIHWKNQVEVEPGSHVEQYSLQYLLRKSAWRRIVTLPKSPSPRWWLGFLNVQAQTDIFTIQVFICTTSLFVLYLDFCDITQKLKGRSNLGVGTRISKRTFIY